MFFGGGFPGGGGMGGMPRQREPVDTEEYYKILGVDKKCSDKDIKTAYRKLAIKHHPDRGGDKATFQSIQTAYDVLSNEEKRALYDEGGKEAVERGSAGGGADDIFSAFFGGGGGGGNRRRGPQKGESVVHKLQVSLENFYNGKTFKMAITRQRVKYPDGMSMDQASSTCKTCNGAGAVLKMQRMGPMIQQVQARCPDCQGQGKTFKDGVQTFQEKKTLEVRVDPGMKHGQKITMSGEADENPGMEAGDVVFVLVQAEHPRFQRKGADLVIEKEISLKDALCGTKFTIKHLDDRTLVVNTGKQVIEPNSLKMIPNEGFPIWKRPFEKGRLFVLFKVKFPKSPLSEATAKLIAQALPNEKEETIPTHSEVEEVETLLATTIEEFGKVNFSAETGNAYDSDDEEGGGHGHGGQKVQCANQ